MRRNEAPETRCAIVATSPGARAAFIRGGMPWKPFCPSGLLSSQRSYTPPMSPKAWDVVCPNCRAIALRTCPADKCRSWNAGPSSPPVPGRYRRVRSQKQVVRFWASGRLISTPAPGNVARIRLRLFRSAAASPGDLPVGFGRAESRKVDQGNGLHGERPVSCAKMPRNREGQEPESR
jgi:hypothetical protein